MNLMSCYMGKVRDNVPVREFNHHRLIILNIFAMFDKGNEGIEVQMVGIGHQAVLKRVVSYLAYSFFKSDTVVVNCMVT